MIYSRVFVWLTMPILLSSILILRNYSNEWTDKGSYQSLYAINDIFYNISDPLFSLIINVYLKFGMSFNFFYVTISIFIFFTFATYIRKIGRVDNLHYLLFLSSFPVYKLAFVNIRQGLALALVLSAVLLLRRRKSFYLDTLLVAVSSLIHISAIFTLFIKLTLRRNLIIVLSILMTISLLLGFTYVKFNGISIYRNDLSQLNDKSLVSLVYLIPLSMLVFVQPKVSFVSVWFLPIIALFFMTDYWIRILCTIYVAFFPFSDPKRKLSKALSFYISLVLTLLTIKDLIEIG